MDFNNLPKWTYTPNLEDTTNNKEPPIKRPPLVGKPMKVLKGLYELPWSSVDDAYGAATLTPYYLDALTSDNEKDREFGIYGLYSATTHQGSVYESSKLAIPFLIDLIEVEVDDPTILASLFLSRIALGENHFIHTPNDVELSKSIYFDDILVYENKLIELYQKTSSEELLRLLCFFPNALPANLDLSLNDDMSDNDDLILAQKLITQGFIAALRGTSDVTKYAVPVKSLMYESPSLLIRGTAAICLIYSGIIDNDALALLAYLGQQDLQIMWAWDYNFNEMAMAAWLYGVDTDSLLNNFIFSPELQLTQVALRLFPLAPNISFNNKIPLLLNELTTIQKQLIKKILKYDSSILRSFEFDQINLPDKAIGLLRVLEESKELLSLKIANKPLWYIIETNLLINDNYNYVLDILKSINSWAILAEIFKSDKEDQFAEQCTLNIYGHFGDNTQIIKTSKLINVFADALINETTILTEYLDLWLAKTKEYEGYDWAFKTPAQRLGVCLLALVKSDKLDSKYYPLIRPYHQYPEFSILPLSNLIEIISYTSKEFQQTIYEKYPDILMDNNF